MKNSVPIFILVILFLVSGSAYAIHTPGVNTNSGVMTFMVTNSADNFALGGEYGLTSELAIMGTFNAPFSRVGAKYQLNPSLALLGGISSDNTPYFGLNGSRWINRDLDAVYEINVLMKDNITLPYELGGRFRLDHNLDLRFGFFGKIDSNMTFPDFKIGVGYRF